jgi:hypothetical protein
VAVRLACLRSHLAAVAFSDERCAQPVLAGLVNHSCTDQLRVAAPHGLLERRRCRPRTVCDFFGATAKASVRIRSSQGKKGRENWLRFPSSPHIGIRGFPIRRCLCFASIDARTSRVHPCRTSARPGRNGAQTPLSVLMAGGYWRIRVGDYRILYEIDHKAKL